MKTENILLIGAVALGGYLLYNAIKGTFKGTSTNEDTAQTNLNTSGYYGGASNNPPNTVLPYNADKKTTQSQSMNATDFQNLIFTPTTATASDRFIIAPGSNGGGVYDRYAQQSIRIETANQRALFTPKTTTPQQSQQNSAIISTVAPTIKKLFTEGLNPQSILN